MKNQAQILQTCQAAPVIVKLSRQDVEDQMDTRVEALAIAENGQREMHYLLHPRTCQVNLKTDL